MDPADPQLLEAVKSNDPDRVRQTQEERKVDLNGLYSFPLWNATITFLHFLAFRGDNDSITTLIELGADPNKEDKCRFTPLRYAAERGHDLVVETLLQKGADPNAVDRDGWTPLMFAATKNHPRCVEILLARGADANMANRHGVTALLHAIDYGSTSCVQLLAPASARVTTRNGLTALEYARTLGTVDPDIESVLFGLEVAALDATKDAVGSALGAFVPEVVREVVEFLFSREICGRTLAKKGGGRGRGK